ncbi:Hypothetical protein POVR1_LOCUS475 [uncultured virus]|nr:Hypothetical protein POVR1_LOCUS475 [uncultured virus]
MLKPSVTVIESFSLSRVDPVDVEEKYKNGYYNTLNIPRVKINIEDRKDVLKKTIDTSSCSDIYTYKDKAGADVIVATTNCDQFRAYNTEAPNICGGRCFYCLRDFKTRPLGIVCEITFEDDIRTYHTEKIFDTFGCIFTYIRKTNWSTTLKDDLIMKTGQMFNDMYPGEPIPYANDMELLKSNQGSLTDEEWENKTYVYEPMSGRIMVPFKSLYVKKKTGE